MIIPDACRVALAVFALRMASRRCFLTAIAVLALVILLVAMAAASGSPAQAAADALLIDTGTNVAFESISGEASGTLDVGTTPEGTAWFRAAAALQFARGFVNPEHAKNLLSKMLSEAVCLHRRAGMSGTGTAAEPDTNSVLEVEKIAEVDFGMNSGTRVGAVSVGTTSDGRVWLTAQDALQFACGGASDARAKQKLAAMVKADNEPEGFHRGR